SARISANSRIRKRSAPFVGNQNQYTGKVPVWQRKRESSVRRSARSDTAFVGADCISAQTGPRCLPDRRITHPGKGGAVIRAYDGSGLAQTLQTGYNSPILVI